MQQVKKASILVFGLSLLIQAIPLACQGLSVSTYKKAESIGLISNAQDTTWGYFTFVLSTSAISVLLFIYLLVTKIVDKSAGMVVDWIITHTVIILQFAIATVEAAQLRNTSKAYQSYMTSLDLLNAMGATGDTVDTLTNYKKCHDLRIATIVLVYLIGFLCTFLVTAWYTKEKHESRGAENAKEVTLANINPN